MKKGGISSFLNKSFYFYEFHNLKQVPQGMKNPTAVILCSSSSEVLGVHALCTTILQSYKNIKCVAAINDKSERSLVVSKLSK